MRAAALIVSVESGYRKIILFRLLPTLNVGTLLIMRCFCNADLNLPQQLRHRVEKPSTRNSKLGTRAMAISIARYLGLCWA